MDISRLSQTISEKRKELNLTQAALAARLHVTDKTVSKWENGYVLPDISILPELAATLGMSVDELLGSGTDFPGVASGLPAVTDVGNAGNAAGEKERETVRTPSSGNRPVVVGHRPREVHVPLFAGEPKVDAAEFDSSVYRLNLRQATHNQFTVPLVLCYLLLLACALSVGNFYIDFTTSRYYPAIIFAYQNGSLSDPYALSLAMIICNLLSGLFIAVSSIVLIVKTVNGTNNYSLRLSAVIAAAVLFNLLFAAIAVPFINRLAGEVKYHVSWWYSGFFAVACLQMVLAKATMSHKRPKRRIRAFAAVTAAVMLAVGIPAPLFSGALVPDELVIYENQFLNNLEFSVMTSEYNDNDGKTVRRSTLQHMVVAVESNRKIKNLIRGVSTDGYGVKVGGITLDGNFFELWSDADVQAVGMYRTPRGFLTIIDILPAHTYSVIGEMKVDAFHLICDGIKKEFNVTGTREFFNADVEQIIPFKSYGWQNNAQVLGGVAEVFFSPTAALLGYESEWRVSRIESGQFNMEKAFLFPVSGILPGDDIKAETFNLLEAIEYCRENAQAFDGFLPLEPFTSAELYEKYVYLSMTSLDTALWVYRGFEVTWEEWDSRAKPPAATGETLVKTFLLANDLETYYRRITNAGDEVAETYLY